MKVSDYIFQYLKEYGIDDIFMLCGGGCMHLVDSLGKSDINYIPCLHEQTATVAAIGYSQYLNKMGVVLVTTGPGGTNTLTGVAGAWADSMPLLIISGQVKTSDISGETGVRMLGFQEVNIVDMVKPITKYATTVCDAKEIRYHLEKAIYYANEGRKGPVWLDIPLDVQAADVDADELCSFIVPPKSDNGQMQKKAQETWKILEKAKRPVILAGYGIMFGHAYDDFLKLATILDIPVLTTWKGIDFLDDSNPLYCGRPGSTGQRGANFAIQNCDVLLSIGARLDYGQIGYEHQYFAREARKIVIDIDETEFCKFKFPIELPIIGDAGEFIRELLSLNPKAVLCTEWKNKCRDWNRKYPVIQDKFYSTDKISTYAFADQLSLLTTEQYVYAPCCSGVGIEILLQAMRINKGVRVILNCPGLGSMGFGVPNALGVGIASGKKIVCVTGEGGFQLNIQDLETIRHYHLPVKFFVLNNGGYGSVTNMQRNYFSGHYVGSNVQSGLTLPPLDQIAYTYDFHYSKVEKTSALKAHLEKVLLSEDAELCEVVVLEEEKAEQKVTSAIGRDGKMHSRPLEDLWPFLPREEFEKEMIIPPISEV